MRAAMSERPALGGSTAALMSKSVHHSGHDPGPAEDEDHHEHREGEAEDEAGERGHGSGSQLPEERQFEAALDLEGVIQALGDDAGEGDQDAEDGKGQGERHQAAAPGGRSRISASLDRAASKLRSVGETFPAFHFHHRDE